VATVLDHLSAFERCFVPAQAAHERATKAATSAFYSACRQAERVWHERLEKARQAFEAGKSTPGEGFDAIRREFEEASTSRPDVAAAREQLAKDVAAADAALNDMLAAARRELFTARSRDDR
jgi:hypothetical protein